MPTASLKSTYELAIPAQQAIDFFRDVRRVLSLYPTVNAVEEQKDRPDHFTVHESLGFAGLSTTFELQFEATQRGSRNVSIAALGVRVETVWEVSASPVDPRAETSVSECSVVETSNISAPAYTAPMWPFVRARWTKAHEEVHEMIRAKLQTSAAAN